MIEYFEYDRCFEYMLNGKLHRPNGPARIFKYDQTDSVWFLNGEMHRYYGPVMTSYYGPLSSGEHWSIHDRFVK